MNKKAILLVEDNPDDAELTLLAFRKNNLANKVMVAHDGAEALDILFGTGDEIGDAPKALPSLILLDLQLAKMNGLEVLRRIRADERTRFLPVVILTASIEDQDLIAGYGLGCNSFVRKPVNFSEFVETIRQLDTYWLLLNQSPLSPK